MVKRLLLILDGASEPLREPPTSLERARTPALDALGREGSVGRLRTVPPGLPAGSECALPALLGWVPPGPVDRGALEAAAAGVEAASGERAWRVDVLDADGRRGSDGAAGAAAARLEADLPAHRVVRIAGHRLLVVGPPPLPPLDGGLVVWPEGELPPRLLDDRTVVVAASGAALGAALLLGARAIRPAGATGGTDTDLRAKAIAARRAITDGAERVVVHVGAPDEAAHARDGAAKSAALERVDAQLVAPLAHVAAAAGGTLRVCPDHGCDPATGEHDSAPVPVLDWPGPGPHGRLTERAVATLPVQELKNAMEAVA
jgi:2,3-bisphosphoglycerate-independent phosphoglycerate mutase